MESAVQIQGEFTFKGQGSTEHPDLVSPSAVIRDESHQQTSETVRSSREIPSMGNLILLNLP